MTSEDIVSETIRDFNAAIADVKSNNGAIVGSLAAEIDAVGMDHLTDYFADVIDDMKGHFGANAANLLERDEDQEDAISSIENWFANNVSGQGSEIAVMCAIWAYGEDKATTDIRSEIAAAAANRP